MLLYNQLGNIMKEKFTNVRSIVQKVLNADACIASKSHETGWFFLKSVDLDHCRIDETQLIHNDKSDGNYGRRREG